MAEQKTIDTAIYYTRKVVPDSAAVLSRPASLVTQRMTSESDSKYYVTSAPSTRVDYVKMWENYYLSPSSTANDNGSRDEATETSSSQCASSATTAVAAVISAELMNQKTTSSSLIGACSMTMPSNLQLSNFHRLVSLGIATVVASAVVAVQSEAAKDPMQQIPYSQIKSAVSSKQEDVNSIQKPENQLYSYKPKGPGKILDVEFPLKSMKVPHKSAYASSSLKTSPLEYKKGAIDELRKLQMIKASKESTKASVQKGSQPFSTLSSLVIASVGAIVAAATNGFTQKPKTEANIEEEPDSSVLSFKPRFSKEKIAEMSGKAKQYFESLVSLFLNLKTFLRNNTE